MRLNDSLSLSGCYWYAQSEGSIVPMGNENDSIKNNRPDFVHRKVQ